MRYICWWLTEYGHLLCNGYSTRLSLIGINILVLNDEYYIIMLCPCLPGFFD